MFFFLSSSLPSYFITGVLFPLLVTLSNQTICTLNLLLAFLFSQLSWFNLHTKLTFLYHFFASFSLTVPFIRLFALFIFFQNFLAANSQCWWNGPLSAATRALKYAGHVAPGMLLVTAEPCALEVLRGAYARSVLKPPATYVISAVGKSQY